MTILTIKKINQIFLQVKLQPGLTTTDSASFLSLTLRSMSPVDTSTDQPVQSLPSKIVAHLPSGTLMSLQFLEALQRLSTETNMATENGSFIIKILIGTVSTWASVAYIDATTSLDLELKSHFLR